MSSGLGKGLDSIFGTSPENFDYRFDEDTSEDDLDLVDGELCYIPIELIDTEPGQPRKDFDEGKLQDLANSIREHGLMQPILVNPLDNGRYRLLAGERRYRAARIAGLETLPGILREVDAPTALQMALIENIQRQDLNPIEQAAAMQELATKHGMSQEEVAKRLAMPRSTVANYLRLMQLPDDVQDLVASGKLSMGHAKALLGLGDPAQMSEVAGWALIEGHSVRETEERVQQKLQSNQTIKDVMAGKDGQHTSAARKKREIPPEFKDAQERMSQYLDAKVRITGSDKKGKITIEYGSPEQLERIFSQLRDQSDASEAEEE